MSELLTLRTDNHLPLTAVGSLPSATFKLGISPACLQKVGDSTCMFTHTCLKQCWDREAIGTTISQSKNKHTLVKYLGTIPNTSCTGTVVLLFINRFIYFITLYIWFSVFGKWYYVHHVLFWALNWLCLGVFGTVNHRYSSYKHRTCSQTTCKRHRHQASVRHSLLMECMLNAVNAYIWERYAACAQFVWPSVLKHRGTIGTLYMLVYSSSKYFLAFLQQFLCK